MPIRITVVCVPSNLPYRFTDLTCLEVKTFEDYDRYLPAKNIKAGHIYDRLRDPREIRQKLDSVKGHLVWMPLDFLKDAKMAETGLQVNSLTESIYT